MKVNIYRLLFFVLLGMLIGFSTGSYFTTKVLLNNLPPTTEVSVGKIKLRGRDNTATVDLNATTEENTSEMTRRERRRQKRK